MNSIRIWQQNICTLDQPNRQHKLANPCWQDNPQHMSQGFSDVLTITVQTTGNMSSNLPSPIQLVLCARELLTLPQTTSSVSHTSIYLRRAATISTALCHQLPRDERDFSTIFSNFQNILAAFIFFHNRYILTTNLVTLREKNKNLAYRSVGRCLQSARSDSPGVCSEQCAAEKQHFQPATANSSVNHLQSSVSKHLSLTECSDL